MSIPCGIFTAHHDHAHQAMPCEVLLSQGIESSAWDRPSPPGQAHCCRAPVRSARTGRVDPEAAGLRAITSAHWPLLTTLAADEAAPLPSPAVLLFPPGSSSTTAASNTHPAPTIHSQDHQLSGRHASGDGFHRFTRREKASPGSPRPTLDAFRAPCALEFPRAPPTDFTASIAFAPSPRRAEQASLAAPKERLRCSSATASLMLSITSSLPGGFGRYGFRPPPVAAEPPTSTRPPRPAPPTRLFRQQATTASRDAERHHYVTARLPVLLGAREGVTGVSVDQGAAYDVEHPSRADQH